MQETEIEWADMTWNPETGCDKGCAWCYAAKFARRLAGRFGYPEAPNHFKPTWHEDEFKKMHKPIPLGDSKKDPGRHGKIIFTVSMGDLFTKGAKKEWSERVLGTIRSLPNHTFVILTKQPENIPRFWPRHHIRDLPPNLWLGVSITDLHSKKMLERLQSFRYDGDWKRVVSFEPLRGRIAMNLRKIDWVIIGAETGNQKEKVVPQKSWIGSILAGADHYKIPVFMKDNLKEAWGDNLRREFP